MNKYEKLTSDILAVIEKTNYIEMDKNAHIIGTENKDFPGLFLPRWSESKVEEAAEKAGIFAGKDSAISKAFGKSYFVLIIPSSDRGDLRAKRAEAVVLELEKLGYNSMAYMAMD